MSGLTATWRSFLTLLDSGDGFALGLAALILCFLGHTLVAQERTLTAWGQRLGLVAFSLYLGRAIHHHGFDRPEDLVADLLRALLAGAIAMSVGWIGLTLLGTARQAAGSLLAWPRRLAPRWVRRRPVSELVPLRSLAPSAPVPDDTRREAARRRSEARFLCEMAYHRHAAELAGRLSREQVDQLVTRYLADETLGPQEIDRRRDAILRLMQDVHADSRPSCRYGSLAELIQAREAQKQQIRDLNLDALSTDALLLDIDTQYDDLSRRFVRGH